MYSVMSLFGVIRAHLFLIDVFLEDIAEDIRVDFVIVFERGGRRGATGIAQRSRKAAQTPYRGCQCFRREVSQVGVFGKCRR